MENEALTKLSNIQMEKSALACLMSVENAYQLNESNICEDTFCANRHKLIFNAIKDFGDSNPNDFADVVVVRDRLQAKEQLEDAGGEKYLGQLLSESPATIFNLRSYIAVLNDLKSKRNALKAITEAHKKILNPEIKADAVISDCVDALLVTETQDKKYSNADMDECLDEAIKQMAKTVDGGDPFYTFGMPTLENKISIVEGNLVVVAGRPGMGKTVLAENITRGIAKRKNEMAVIFSLEMPKAELMKRMIASEASVNLSHVRNCRHTSTSDWALINPAVHRLRDLKIRINEKPRMTVSQIRTEINKLRKQHGKIGVIMIDYLQIMGGIGAENRANEIGIVTASLKAMAKEYNCPIILLAQLNRGCESRPNKRPVLSDMKGSGSIEQDADVVLLIHREDYYNTNTDKAMTGVAEINIAKNRAGEKCVVNMHFNGAYQRFDEIAGY